MVDELRASVDGYERKEKEKASNGRSSAFEAYDPERTILGSSD